jgi:hypothetical protein
MAIPMGELLFTSSPRADEADKKARKPIIEGRKGCQSVTCRCGNTIVAGTRHLVIREVQEDLADSLGTQSFCSMGCIRAYILETIELQDATGSKQSDSLASSLRAAFNLDDLT